VLNGTSTSNKVALGALVTDGDLVLFDRNNHKAGPSWRADDGRWHSGLHPDGPQRLGLIGPMRWDAIDETSLRDASAAIRWSRTGSLAQGRGRSGWPWSSNAPMTARSTVPR
jgi:arginine/lysine/ornithine decarboxylase